MKFDEHREIDEKNISGKVNNIWRAPSRVTK
jgi:hypothetical protein